MYKCILCKKELFKNYSEMLCDNCRTTIASYLRLEVIHKEKYRIYIIFFYEGEIKKLIRRFKFSEGTYLAKVFSIYLARAIIEAKLHCKNISYIPMYAKKKDVRGFDQSELLAKETSKRTGLEFQRIVTRGKRTKSLYRLNREERKKELLDAFKLNAFVDDVIIIDDIYTTGSTIHEVSKTLEGNNIRNYNFLVLA